MDFLPPGLHSELEDRLRFEILMTDLSTRFASVTCDRVGDEIVDPQRPIVQALEPDRSTLRLQSGLRRQLSKERGASAIGCSEKSYTSKEGQAENRRLVARILQNNRIASK